MSCSFFVNYLLLVKYQSKELSCSWWADTRFCGKWSNMYTYRMATCI